MIIRDVLSWASFLCYKYHMIGLGEYIMKELGEGVYDELEIDPSDYDSLPAYDFYDEVVSSCQVVHPEIIERYYRETENAICRPRKKNSGNTRI